MSDLSSLPADHSDPRAGDADRDRVAAVLGEALATGHLNSAEHADRLDAAYAAKTVGELVPLTRDVPDVTAGPGAPTGVEHQTVSATFSKMIRSGRWVASRHTVLRSTFGALIVDLTDAVLPGREVTLDLHATFGKLIIKVPPGAQILAEGGALFGKWSVQTGAQSSEAGPVIRVTGGARFGKVIVSRK